MLELMETNGRDNKYGLGVYESTYNGKTYFGYGYYGT